MSRSILILHCHDLGRFAGAYGVETVSTPHIDALADGATLFESAFATAPHCSPARASLFTGNYPQQHGVLGLAHQPFGWDLIDPSTHIAHRLRDQGYRTELIGVHHESADLPDDQIATRLGFDRARTASDRDTVVARAQEALALAATSERPFYLQVGFHEPHRTPSDRDDTGIMGFLGDAVDPDSADGVSVPSYLAATDEARAEIAELQGAVRYMDEGVGSILATLERLGLDEDTVVVFTTDHGLALPRAKCTLYDAGVGVALIIRVPGRPLWAARRIGGLVSHVDVLPTLMELTSAGPVADVAGSSLVPLVEDDVPAREHAFGQLTYHTYFDPKRSVRSSDAKLILNLSNAPQAMDPTQSWMHRSVPVDLRGPTIGTSPVLEFYDLRTDPNELDNRIDDTAYADRIAELAEALQDWMRRVDDPLLSQPTSPRHAQALSTLAQIVRARPTADAALAI
ncbi:sulfatase [Microbacterium sp. H1-D42]|uniref:sulfatase family protein n=1 Tax=Microbacterium sp. H1-D42 TaxID=2925844 RepID=UPI001F535CD6|nr:sulfatase [Microbacterium sp. H1-D42]UNK71393.1 sulfatase [Microbacterium sp. H1-D42]